MPAARAWLILLALAPWAAAEDVAALAAQLTTDRAHEAADRLAELGPAAKDAVPQLIAALQAEDPELRWRAGWALSRIGPDAGDAATALVTAAERKDGLPATAARIALTRIGKKATDAVLAAMLAAPERERAQYIPLLRAVEPDPQRVVPAVLPLLTDQEVACSVCYMLAEMKQGAAPAAPALVRSMNTGGSVSFLADMVLVAIGEPSVAPLRALAMDATKPPDVRARAIGILAKIGGSGVVAAGECLRRKTDWLSWELSVGRLRDAGPGAAGLAPLLEERVAERRHVPHSAVDALRSMGPDGEAVLERLLFTAPTECRADLARQLGSVRCSKSVPWLLRLADASEPPEVRHAALESLAESRLDADQARRAATLAERALEEDPATACALAGSLGPAGLFLAEKLRALLKDSRPEVRASAASALCRMGKGGDAEVSILAEVVEGASKGTDGPLYHDALQCLASAGTQAAADYELLVTALAGDDSWARSIAAHGLVRMLPALGENKRRVLAAVQASGEFPWHGVSDMEDAATLIELFSLDRADSAAFDRLVALGSRSWASLNGALDSPDPSTRSRAAEALLRIHAGKAGERAWFAALGSVLVAYRIEDLCAAQPEVAIPNLMNALVCNDPKVRGHAAHLIGQLAYRDAIPVLREIVAHDADQDARGYALWALGLLLEP